MSSIEMIQRLRRLEEEEAILNRREEQLLARQQLANRFEARIALREARALAAAEALDALENADVDLLELARAAS